MKRSFLLSGVSTLIVLGGIGVYVLNSQGPGARSQQTLSFLVPVGQQAVYRVSYEVDQKPQGGETFTAYQLSGKLVAYPDSAGELVTEWGDLTDFQIVGVPAPTNVLTAMIGKPMVTRASAEGELEHYIGQDFPGRYLGLQLNILDKAYIPVSAYRDETVNRRERDELGQYNVQYSYQKAPDESYTVTRRWLTPTDNRTVIDANANTFTYSYSPEGQLRKVDGRLIVNYKKANGVDVYTTRFSMEIDGIEPAVEQKVTQSTRGLPKADLGRAEVASRAALAEDVGEDSLPTIENLEQALARSDSYTAESPGSEQQEIFQTIQLGVMANPSEAGKVIDRILAIKGQDNDSEARSSLLFGALTATGLPEVADAFADMAQSQCPNDLCRIQAITSLNIHEHPSSANGKALIGIAHSSENDDIVSAAYLAAGSIASKIGNESQEFTQTLLQDFQRSSAERRVSLLQAMGNHGAAEYYPILENQAKSEDTFERSSALYSMRNVPVDGATQALIASLDVEGSDIVNVNSLRALALKNLSAPEQIRVAEAVTASTDKDVQAAVTDLLLNNYRANVEGSQEALATYKEKASDPDLKSYLDEVVEDIRKDREKDYLYK